jgi:5-formyltetrahydrofolate cyclo-ligase
MKHKIRKKILEARENHEESERSKKDSAIEDKMFSLHEFKKAKIILFYVSIRGEVRTDKMISESLEKGKRILVPFADLKNKRLLISEINDLDELSPGAFGIPEPKNPREFPLEKIDLVIIPGIAFDKKGNRVGYGMGFYDRFLKGFKSHVPKIALAYDLQIVSEIPADGDDVRVDKVITEKEIIEC